MFSFHPRISVFLSKSYRYHSYRYTSKLLRFLASSSCHSFFEATQPPPQSDQPPAEADGVDAAVDRDSDGISPTTLNDPASERGGNASTWASTSFDDDDVDRIADNLSAEEIQMFEQVRKFLSFHASTARPEIDSVTVLWWLALLVPYTHINLYHSTFLQSTSDQRPAGSYHDTWIRQENAFLMDELQNTSDDVKKIEGQVIEIARLQVSGHTPQATPNDSRSKRLLLNIGLFLLMTLFILLLR